MLLEDLTFSQQLLWRVLSSGIQRRVTRWKTTNFSKDHAAPHWFPASLTLQPWRWRLHVPPKRLLTFNRLHAVTAQKMELFIKYSLSAELNIYVIKNKILTWYIVRVFSSQSMNCYEKFNKVTCKKQQLQLTSTHETQILLKILANWNKRTHLSTTPSVCSVCSRLLTLVPHSRIYLPWRWRRYFTPKRRFTQDLHGTTSQKTEFFK
jgi:hypothetical protein